MNYLKNIFSNRFAIALTSFFLGAGALWGTQELWQRIQLERNPISTFQFGHPDTLSDWMFRNHLFSESRDPLQEMREMHRQMMKDFGFSIFDSENFFSTFNQSDLNANEAYQISKREDSNYVYYDISLNGSKPKKFEVKVEEGHIIVSGELEKKLEDGNQNSLFSSSFHRSFPAPNNTDPKKVEIENYEDKITLKFPKV